ncbi:MAG: hypothetical protein RL266_1921 [Bacteroidota bacterium]|jgi:hypothetical protein
MKFSTSHSFIAILLAAFTFQSCGNIDIVKRRYRPGFHVELSTKQQDRRQINESDVAVGAEEKLVQEIEKTPETASATVISTDPIVEFTASTQPTDGVKVQPKKVGKQNVAEILFTPFTELKQEKLNGELRRAVFQSQEDEKHGWSVLGIVGMSLGVLGLGLVATGLAFLVSFIFSGGIGFWWIFCLVGLILGIAAMVTGILGMRETGRGEKRGRGFALAGMISGIVSLALGLIGLVWGLIYTFIQRLNDE